MYAIPRPSRILRAVLAATTTATLAACSTPIDPYTECRDANGAATVSTSHQLPDVDQPLVLAIAVHQGAPAPGLPAAIEPLVKATLAAGQPVRVIAIDGTPEQLPAVPTNISTNSCDGYTTTLNTAMNNLIASLTAAKADSDGNDLYQAIAVAADTARSLSTDGTATVVVIDSGLADTGPLDFTTPGMTLADPAQAAKYAASTWRLNLKGIVFNLLLGYTALPQKSLSGTERDNVAAIWAATIVRLGAAKVTQVTAPRPDDGPTTSHTTSVAPVVVTTPFTPPTKSTKPVTTVFHENQIRFLPDSVDLANPAAARKALTDVAGWLAAARGHHVKVTGTTASAGTEQGRLSLSRARAITIQRLLLDTNPAITVRQIHTTGVGTHFPDYIYDRRSDGTLDPLIAPANRTVRITASTTR